MGEGDSLECDNSSEIWSNLAHFANPNVKLKKAIPKNVFYIFKKKVVP